jgi:hypothetical protein
MQAREPLEGIQYVGQGLESGTPAQNEGNIMKKLLVMLCLISSTALAQESIYDYQGLVMTGTSDFYGQVIPDTETYTAALTFFGPLTSPSTAFDVLVRTTGTSGPSGELENGCLIGGGCPAGTVILNTKGNTLTSADISIPDFNVVIGAKGDNIVLVDLTGKTLISVSNSTPGTWSNATPGTTTQAPELDPATVGGGATLLVGGLLVLRGRRQQGIAA